MKNKNIYLKYSNPKISYNFGIAEMDFAPPTFLIDSMNEYKEIGYGNVHSTLYFKCINSWISNRHSIRVLPFFISYTPSIRYAINKIVKTSPFSTKRVLNFIPNYNGYNNLLDTNEYEIFNMHYKELFNEDLTLFLNNVVEINNINIILISNPHNPTGAILNEKQLQVLNDICLSYNILLLIDEAHADLVQGDFYSCLHFTNENIVCFKTIGKTFNISGVVGAYFLTSSQRIRDSFENVKNKDGVDSPNIHNYIATIEGYSRKGEEWLRHLNQKILDNKLFLKTIIKKEFSNFLSYEMQYGSYLAWIDYSKINISEQELSSCLKTRGIKVIFSSKYNFKEKYLRINLACSKEKILYLLEELKDISKSQK